MPIKKRNFRQVKKIIGKLLLDNNFNTENFKLSDISDIQIVNALFSFFYSSNKKLKKNATILMGVIVDRMAEKNMESARIIMRRLMWNLNDESGGIGWGSPEAMGEIMARNNTLACEYSKILVSYIKRDGNFIEHKELRDEVILAIKRVAAGHAKNYKQSNN
ncbi:MAG: hypothetical protein B6I31_01410 [Desulfobacteraceae bacterium 4572_19]|nr:MAG: hypothetical protein B6I31_01410 [Desulfobacteraceae bacterium 4572_19]